MFKLLAKQPQSLNHNVQFNFGAGIKALRLRMKTIRSIGKITKAMKMVAASKMRVEIQRMEKGQHFGVSAVQTMLANESYLQKKNIQPNVKRVLLVPMTGDKGLCGGCNSSIVRATKEKVNSSGQRDKWVLFPVGMKGTNGLLRPFPDLLVKSIDEVVTPFTFASAASIGHQLDTYAAENNLDQIDVIYNKFVTVVSSKVTSLELLTRKNFLAQFKHVTKHDSSEPDKDYAKHYFYELYLGSQIYQAFLNNSATEQSSRMAAMENASKNAGEILQKLTLKYNNARQALITQELCEIISGASALD